MAESGLFYSLVIDPLLKSIRKRVAGEIREGETVIDIACGTGAQIFQIAEKTKRAVGIDLSESMIKYARQQSKTQRIKNVEFVVADAVKLPNFTDKEIDVAIMSLALHQFQPEIYNAVLNEIKRISKRVIIVDYAVPLPNNMAGLAINVIEFMAGREHNRCFRKYYKMGGLEKILPKNNLCIEKIKPFGGGAFNLVICCPV